MALIAGVRIKPAPARDQEALPGFARICDDAGWQRRTLRAFFTGLKKRQGIEVEALERMRQVAPNKGEAKGSYSIDRVAG
jgi:hypothetical protein